MGAALRALGVSHWDRALGDAAAVMLGTLTRTRARARARTRTRTRYMCTDPPPFSAEAKSPGAIYPGLAMPEMPALLEAYAAQVS